MINSLDEYTSRMPKIAFYVMSVLSLLAFATKPALGQCGPQAYAPVIQFRTTNGQTHKIVRKAKFKYEAYMSFHFQMESPAPLGFNIRLFDQFHQILGCALETRLDELAFRLQNEPNRAGYIIAHASATDRSPVTMNRVMAGFAKLYLMNVRGIDADRIVTINGYIQQETTIEEWVGPKLEYQMTDAAIRDSTDQRIHTINNIAISIPADWRRLDDGAVTFSPAGSFKGPGLFSRGVEVFGAFDSENLESEAVETFEQFKKANPDLLRNTSSFEKTIIAGQEAGVIKFYAADWTSNMDVSFALYAIRIAGQPGKIVTVLTAAPSYEYPGYEETFAKILQSIRFINRSP